MTAKEISQELNITIEEARDVLAADDAIDKGADPFPLTEEQKKVEKAMRGTGTRITEQKKNGPTVYSFTQRKRKPNELKRDIIDLLYLALTAEGVGYDEVEKINPERQLSFKIGEKKFELTLVEKRK